MKNRDKKEDLKVVDRFWSEIESSELQSVIAEYPDLGDLKEILFQSSRPLSAGCLFRTTKGEYFIKRNSSQIRSREEWAFEHRLLDALKLSGLGLRTPEILSNNQGHTVHSSFYADEECLYEIQTKGLGDDIYKASHTWSPLLLLNHADSIGRSIAEIHSSIIQSGFQESRDPSFQVSRFEIFYTRDLNQFLKERVSSIRGFEALSGSEKFVEEVTRLYEPYTIPLSEADRIPRMVTHSDPQASNFFWSGDQVESVIDFHLANYNNYLYDLSVAVDRNCIYWLDLLSGKDNAYHIEGVRSILGSYISRSKELGLEQVGIELFRRALVLHRVEFALSLCDYYLNVEDSPFKAQWCLDVYIIGHARWFHSDSGRLLLDSINL